MGILKKLKANAAELKSAPGYTSIPFALTDPKAAQYLANNGSTVVGKNVNETSAMGITTVFACGRLLAETMGAMPSDIYIREKGSGNLTKADDHPLAEILILQPNSDMNGMEYRETRTVNQALRGNCYSIIERRGDGNVASLYPVPASDMRVKRDLSTNFETMYGIPDRGQIEWLPADKIWHQKLFSFNGLDGLSPIALAREAFGLAMAGEEFNARLFGQGLMPSARVSIPAWLTNEQRATANAKLLEMHTGLANMNKPLLLEGGMTVESGLLSPDDAQFLQLRQFSVTELCRLLGVKPHMVAALERATDNNIEKLSLEFVTYTMMPYIRRDETGVRKLFKPADRDKYVLRYNVEGLLRADSAARGALYSILLQNGVLSRNEVRALENRNTSTDEGMDDFTVQLNMTLVDLIEKMAVNTAGQPITEPATADTPPKRAGDTQNINVHLPESFKHELAQRVEVPGVVEVARAVEKSNDNSTSAIELLRRDIQDMTKEVRNNTARIEENTKAALMPVEAVKDAAGEIVGSKKVLKLVK